MSRYSELHRESRDEIDAYDSSVSSSSILTVRNALRLSKISKPKSENTQDKPKTPVITVNDVPMATREDDVDEYDEDDENDMDDDEEMDDDDDGGLTSRSGRSSAIGGSIFQDDEEEPEDEYDSEDERQTEKLENYVLRYANAPPTASFTSSQSASFEATGKSQVFVDRVPDEKTIRKAVFDMARQNRFWGTAAAKKMQLLSVMPTPALHYFLESFAESRTIFWNSEPFTGQTIDGPDGGDPPEPWSIPVEAPTPFAPFATNLEVPHTASVRNCPHCRGRGASKCVKCKAKRNVKCSKCHGSGRTMKQGRRAKCSFCHGRGKKKCATCGGDGKQSCKNCDGACRLKFFITLGVSFHVHKSDYVFEAASGLPPDLVSCETGDVVFEETRESITHIRRNATPRVEEKSKELLSEHETLMESERRLGQRHALTAVPITEIRFRYKGEEGLFWLLGNQLDCYFPQYPEQSLWGCLVS